MAGAAELWNPAAFSTYGSDALELTHPELGELAVGIAQSLRAPKAYKAVKKMYVAVAKELARLNWTDLIDVPDGLYVLSVNVDVSDLTANFKAIYGAARVKELLREGLL